MKRLLAVLCMSACIATTPVVSTYAAEEVVTTTTVDSTTPDEILNSDDYLDYGQTLDHVIQQLDSYSDEEIQEILESTSSDLDKQLINHWNEIKDVVGDYQGVSACESELGDDIMVVTMTFDFTEQDFTMVYTADTNGASVELSLDEGPMTKMEIFKKAGMNTIIGMGTVFLVLIFMSFVISLFGLIPKLFGKKETKETVKEAPKATPVEVPVVEEDVTDDLELVAVISAAIAAAEGTSADGVVIRSIKRAKNGTWKRA